MRHTEQRQGARTLVLVHPAAGDGPSGNRTTVERWSDLFAALGFRVSLQRAWDGTPAEVLVALHATHCHGSIARFHGAFPARPLLVAASGTDVYHDGPPDERAQEAFRLATRIVVLQPLAIERLPPETRGRARVIHQSFERPAGRSPRPGPAAAEGAHGDDGTLRVAFLANVRAVKDPLTAVAAACRLPEDGRIRVLHAGAVLDPALGRRLEAAAVGCAAYRFLGPLPHAEALDLLAGSALALSTSRHEGGANAITEALGCNVPVLATDIPGSAGLLGADYPGLFPVGDAGRLAVLLARVVDDPAFHAVLAEHCHARAGITDPARERAAWAALFDELGLARGA